MTAEEAQEILNEAERLTITGVRVEDRIGLVSLHGHEAAVSSKVWLAMRAITIGVGVAFEREQRRNAARSR